MNKFIAASACFFVLSGCQQANQSEIVGTKELANKISTKIEHIKTSPKESLAEGASIYEELVHKMGAAEGAKASFYIAYETNKRTAMIANPKVTDKDFAAVEKRLEMVLDDELAIFVKDLGTIYADFFTEAEAEELIEFYNSPVGQKISNNQTEIMQLALPYSAALGTRLEARLRE